MLCEYPQLKASVRTKKALRLSTQLKRPVQIIGLDSAQKSKMPKHQDPIG